MISYIPYDKAYKMIKILILDVESQYVDNKILYLMYKPLS